MVEHAGGAESHIETKVPADVSEKRAIELRTAETKGNRSTRAVSLTDQRYCQINPDVKQSMEGVHSCYRTKNSSKTSE